MCAVAYYCAFHVMIVLARRMEAGDYKEGKREGCDDAPGAIVNSI